MYKCTTVHLWELLDTEQGRSDNNVFTSNGDLGVKAPPQTGKQSIFGIMIANQINPRGKTFGLLNINMLNHPVHSQLQ